MFLRDHQLRWKQLNPVVHCHFERIIGLSGPVHRPLSLALPRWFATPHRSDCPNPIDRFRLRQAYLDHTPQWEQFEHAARDLIRQHANSGTRVVSSTNTIQNREIELQLRQLCIDHFPRGRRSVHVTHPLGSITSRMWSARRQLRLYTTRSLKNCFRTWTLIARFQLLHAQIRKYSKINKRNRLETFMQESADLAFRHKLFDWHRRIRSLYPKQPRQRIQMFDTHGAPLLPPAELERIQTYFSDLYNDPTFPPHGPLGLTQLPLTEADLRHQISRLPLTKALAPDGIPALIWKHFATELTPFLYTDVRHSFEQTTCQLPECWTTGWIHLLCKPNKTPNRPEALRPICLQHPMNKVLTGIHCQQLQEHTFPQLRRMPLYAYMPTRGTKECLLIVAAHCRQVRELCIFHAKDPAPHGLWGGLQVSLDLEKAFDVVSRTHVLRSLDLFETNANLRQLVNAWLMPHTYCIPYKDLVARIRASRGIKQGARDAPFLWTICMYHFLHRLLANHSMEWIRDHIVVFADDLHFRWIVHSPHTALMALHDLDLLLCDLRVAGFRVNTQKSVAIMRLVGKQVLSFHRKWCSRPSSGPLLHLPNPDIQIPLVSKASYLGAILSYRAWENDTLQRRLKAAQHCFRTLRRWLMDRHHPLHLRLRLYRQCVYAIATYGVFEMGLTHRGAQQLISMINLHHRTMTRSPVHLIRENSCNDTLIDFF